MHKFLFYNKFITSLYMFRALCAHHQEVKVYYTASGIVTPVGGRPVHRLIEDCIYRVIQNDCRGTIVQRQFRTKFRKQPASDNFIRRWFAQFQETGCVCIPELKARIRTATETITADMLQTVWNELDYRVDVCRVTNDSHIEHL